MNKKQITKLILDGLTDDEIQTIIDNDKKEDYESLIEDEISLDDLSDEPDDIHIPLTDDFQNIINRVVKIIDIEITPSATEQKSLDDLEKLIDGGL